MLCCFEEMSKSCTFLFFTPFVQISGNKNCYLFHFCRPEQIPIWNVFVFRKSVFIKTFISVFTLYQCFGLTDNHMYRLFPPSYFRSIIKGVYLTVAKGKLVIILKTNPMTSKDILKKIFRLRLRKFLARKQKSHKSCEYR